MFANDYPKGLSGAGDSGDGFKRGYRVKEIPVEMKARAAGQSSISFKRSIYYMIKVPLACIMTAFGD